MKIARFQPKRPIIQVATKSIILKITLKTFPANSPIIAHFRNIIFVWVGKRGIGGEVESKLENCHFQGNQGPFSNLALEG